MVGISAGSGIPGFELQDGLLRVHYTMWPNFAERDDGTGPIIRHRPLGYL